jgi:hypothetical protein
MPAEDIGCLVTDWEWPTGPDQTNNRSGAPSSDLTPEWTRTLRCSVTINLPSTRWSGQIVTGRVAGPERSWPRRL